VHHRLDLVEQMIRVAAGEKLPFTQARSRAAAGRSSAASMPKTRSAASCRPPAGWCATRRRSHHDGGRQPVPEGGGVRVDTGVDEGGEIPMHYDSMIAKLIVHGRDRLDAIAKMREALNGFVIRGISSNIPFQAALLAHPKFVAGDFNTGFIAEHYPQGFRAEDVPHDDPDFLVALAAAAYRCTASAPPASAASCPATRCDRRPGGRRGQGRRGVHRHVPVWSDVFEPRPAAAARADGRRPRLCHQHRLELRRHPMPPAAAMASPSPRRSSAGLGCWVAHNGWQIEAQVLSPRAAELLRADAFKAPPT
jgi:propionyl-CoA carboxylase alpha chain